MKKDIIYTTGAPAPGGALSQAVKAGETIYLAGQVGFDRIPCKWSQQISMNRPVRRLKICCRWQRPQEGVIGYCEAECLSDRREHVPAI